MLKEKVQNLKINRYDFLLFVTTLVFFYPSKTTAGNFFPDKRVDISYEDSLSGDRRKKTPLHPKKKEQTPKDPKKALLYASICPGLGQVYNKKYWKLPLVYGAFAALIPAVQFNNQYYRLYIHEYNVRTDNDPNTNGDPAYDFVKDPNTFLRAATINKRNRDLAIIGMVAFYGLQILDAFVDAQLSTFDISDNLALSLAPVIGAVNPNPINGSPIRNHYTGLSFRFNLKK